MAADEGVDWLDRLKKNIEDMLYSKNYSKYAQLVRITEIPSQFLSDETRFCNRQDSRHGV